MLQGDAFPAPRFNVSFTSSHICCKSNSPSLVLGIFGIPIFTYFSLGSCHSLCLTIYIYKHIELRKRSWLLQICSSIMSHYGLEPRMPRISQDARFLLDNMSAPEHLMDRGQVWQVPVTTPQNVIKMKYMISLSKKSLTIED